MRALPVFVFFALLGLVSAGCKSKVTKDNYDKIVEGMTLKEVENILGEGKQQSDGSGVAAQVGVNLQGAGGGGNAQAFVWESDNAKITVYFVNGAVKTKTKTGNI
jgi:hypothetical protein